MDLKYYKKALSLYVSLIHYYLKEGERVLDYNDEPYINFLSVLYDVLKKDPYYDEDIFTGIIDRELRRFDKFPENLNEQTIKSLIELIKRTFILNKDVHYLILPLYGSKFSSDMIFDNFYFLTNREENQYLSLISELTSIDKNKVEFLLNHTRKSRSPDFLKHNLVLVKIDNQTSLVKMKAANIAKHLVYILKLIHYSEGFHDDIFITHSVVPYDLNHHVAILSADSWRCGHGNWWDDLYCRIDLNFLAEGRYQEKLIKLYNDFVISNDTDLLNNKFHNALILFNQALRQREFPGDDTLALLIFFAAAESLLTEDQNEKRLRLSAIIPRLVDTRGVSIYDTAKLIDDLYIKRNNFVHAGKMSPFLEEKNPIEVLQYVIASLISKYLVIDKILPVCAGEKRITAWLKYIDCIFKDVIFGKDDKHKS